LVEQLAANTAAMERLSRPRRKRVFTDEVGKITEVIEESVE
jgi:hypothetical protein